MRGARGPVSLRNRETEQNQGDGPPASAAPQAVVGVWWGVGRAGCRSLPGARALAGAAPGLLLAGLSPTPPAGRLVSFLCVPLPAPWAPQLRDVAASLPPPILLLLHSGLRHRPQLSRLCTGCPGGDRPRAVG